MDPRASSSGAQNSPFGTLPCTLFGHLHDTDLHDTATTCLFPDVHPRCQMMPSETRLFSDRKWTSKIQAQGPTQQRRLITACGDYHIPGHAKPIPTARM